MRIWEEHQGFEIRVTDERLAHIEAHPELRGRLDLVIGTLAKPDTVVLSTRDSAVRLYHRFMADDLVGEKYLCAVIKWSSQDRFLLTAFFTDRVKRGTVIWPAS